MKALGRKKTFLTYVEELIEIYVTKRVSRSSAELSYFLTLSIFPTLICVYAIVSRFLPGMSLTLDGFEGIIPGETLETIQDYMAYISSNNSQAMLTAGIRGMATTSAAAFRSIHNIMADIQGQSRFKGIFKLFFSFVFSLLFLAAIYFAAVVMVTGDWLLRAIASFFPRIAILSFWLWLKFPLMLFVFVIIIYGLYRITAPRETKGYFFPGAVAAAIILVLVSVLFSEFISFSTRYPLIYGPLVSIIIYMLWMYICGNILIMCNALNFLLRKHRGGKVKKKFPIIEEDSEENSKEKTDKSSS